MNPSMRDEKGETVKNFYEDKKTKEYIDEMKAISESLKLTRKVRDKKNPDEFIDEPKEVDDNFYVKFGHLKKAAVLKYYGRETDAYKEIIKAGKIVREQREINKRKDEAIQQRWRFKLGIDDGVIPFPLDKYHPDDPRMEEKLRKLTSDERNGIPLSTIKLYI